MVARGLPSSVLRVLACATLACTAASCSERMRPVEHVPETTPLNLEDRYRAVWLSMDVKADARPERELLQLGVPTPSSLVLWHLPERGQHGTATVLLDGAPPGAGCLTRSAPAPWPSPSPNPTSEMPQLPERIELGCLTSSSVHQVHIGSVTLTAKTAPDANNEEPFSFLAWSCNNPYSNRSGALTFELNKINSLGLLRARAQGEIAPDGLPHQPSFQLALGDQIYVDGDNEVRDAAHTLSLFVGDGSRSRFAPADTPRLLDTIYRYHFAIPPLDAALGATPAAMVWDDHDIRDGWGSHGDECKGDWPQYFQAARQAFVAYQGQRNPTREIDPASEDLDVLFRWGKTTSTFSIDGRTNRKFESHTIISPTQFERLCLWLGEPRNCAEQPLQALSEAPGAKNDEPHLYVLGSPSPIATVDKGLTKWVGACNSTNSNVLLGEGSDDVRDTWFCNRDDQRKLLTLLASHFVRHPKQRLIVVSGDVHWSGITSLQYLDPARNQVVQFGHEVISSGLTNDHVKTFGERRGAWEGGYLVENEGRQIYSEVHGSIVGSPSFAEVVVQPGAGTLDLSVLFYPSRVSTRGGENSLRSLANDWRTLSRVHTVRSYDFSADPHAGNPGLFFTRVPLAQTVPSGPGRTLHQASVVCVANVDSAADATTWREGRPDLTCDAPR